MTNFCKHALSHKGAYTIQEIGTDAHGKETLSEIAHHAIHSADQHNQPPKNLEHLTGKYYCPMLCEGDKVYDSNVGCPVCGMDLVKIGGNPSDNTEVHHLKTFTSRWLLPFRFLLLPCLA